MAKRWPLGLLACLAALAVLGVACPGPPGAVGPTGSPGPTGNQGARGSLQGLTDSSLFRQVVIDGSGNQLSVSLGMIHVGSEFCGNLSFTPANVGPINTLATNSWGRVLIACSNGSYARAGFDNNLVNFPDPKLGGRPSRQIGWVRQAAQLVPARQIDRRVAYFPGSRPTFNNLNSGAFASIDLTGAVPPGARTVFIQTQLQITGGTLNAASSEADWSLDGTVANTEVLARCFAPAATTVNCVNDSAITLDPAQHFLYKVTSGGSASILVTGYMDETL